MVFSRSGLLFLSASVLVAVSQAELQCQLENRFVNASDSISFWDPFRTPTGLFRNGSGEWTWTLATQSGALSGNDTLVSQVLRLNVVPEPDLLFDRYGPNIPLNEQYTGCGVIAHGLRHDVRVRGQNDTSGTCSGSLSAPCRERLRFLAEEKARRELFLGVDAESKCRSLETLGDGGEIQECAEDFVDDWWLESFAFASDELDDSNCRFQPAGSNETHAIHTWAESRYGLASLDPYQNLTSLIEPIITVFFKSLPDAYEEQWAKAQIMCLRTGENVRRGSVAAPAQADVPGGSSALMAPFVLLLASLFLSLSGFLS